MSQFSCGASAEKNAENLMEVTVQGELMQELGQLCHELYDVLLFDPYHIDSTRVYVCSRWEK